MSDLSKTDILLLDILKSALQQEEPSPIVLDTKQWEALLKASQKQGVTAIVLQQVLRCENNIPKDIKLRWALQSRHIEKINHLQQQALFAFNDLMQKNAISVMCLKGLGLGLLYPQPSYRECGDVDIYCHEAYDKVNDIVARQGIGTHHEDEKHCSFKFRGITIENHRNFAYSYNKVDRAIRPVLEKTLPLSPCCDERLPNILLPSPNANALYLLHHSIGHLVWSGVGLRHCLDWYFFLKRHHNTLDWHFLEQVWQQSHLLYAAALISGVCHKYLGMPQAWFPLKEEVKRRDIERIISDIMNPISMSSATSNVFKKLYRKSVQYHRRCWKHRLLLQEPFPDGYFKAVFKKQR